MPNFSDYNEHGEMINPYFDEPIDTRTIEQRVSDYFDPDAEPRLFWRYDLYSDWLYYPPIIRTKEHGKKLYLEKIKDIYSKFKNIDYDGDTTILVNGFLNKFKIKEQLNELIGRFTQEGKPLGWSRYKERAKILKEQGKDVKEGLLEEKQEYVIEFSVEVPFRLKVKSNMNIDDLFDYYCEGSGGSYHMKEDMFKEMVANGEAKMHFDHKELDVSNESLYIMKVRDNNHIVESRIF